MGLYGSDDRYVVGALRNAELAPSVFPGWRLRFYYDSTVPADVITKLKAMGCEMILMPGTEGGIAGMFWRFLVADDQLVDRYIVRDADSRLHSRDYMAVLDWIKSGKKFHFLRDHPHHGGFPINGGMWGGVKDPTLKLGEGMKNFPKANFLEDMHFLDKFLYPRVKDNDSIAHDSYSCKSWPNSYPVPTPRCWSYHIGQVFDKDDKGRQHEMDAILHSGPPPACTPKFPFT